MLLITQSESGLTAGDYAELKAAQDGATYRMTLQRINFDWSLLNGSDSTLVFDACASTNRLIRATLDGTTITVEYSTGGAWATLTTIAGLTGSIQPALYASGSDVRVFYYDAGTIYYKASADEGDTWGAAAPVDTLANVEWLAPTSLAKLHVVTYDGYNSRLHYYSHSAVWVQADSDWYYPGQLNGFDAETIDDVDVLVFAALGPVRYTMCRQGVWAVRQIGEAWGDPTEIDVLDEYESGSEQRTRPRCSYVGSLLFGSYLATDAGTTRAAFTRSATGRFWEHRQPMGALDYEGVLLTLGDYTYYVGASEVYRSASTVIVGNSTVETDVTSRVGSYAASRQRAHQSAITLHNDDAGLDLTGTERWQIKEELGYFAADGDPLLAQVALTEIDTVSHKRSLPTNVIALSARDRMAWLMDRTEADHYEEFESQLRHYDDFHNAVNNADQKTILNSGMRHTATMAGYWSTEDHQLLLRSNNKTGLALCTRDKFIGHTVVQQAIKVPTTGNDEWAGVVFRALDEDNHWLAYYDQATDKVKLRQKIAGDYQTAVAESSTLSWSVATWYWIRVEARLSSFTVYTSTDGRTWTSRIAYVDVTMTAARAAFQEGYVGHAGYGYSDEDYEPYEPPPYVPPPPLGDTFGIGPQFFIGTVAGGVAWAPTADVINSPAPTWTALNGGLSTAYSKAISDLVYVQSLSALYACTKDGLYEVNIPVSAGSTWQCLISAADAIAGIGVAADECYFQGMAVSWINPLTQWCVVAAKTTGVVKYPHYVLKTSDGWTSFSWAPLPYSNLPGDTERAGSIAVARHSGDLTLWATGNDDTFDGGLYKSVDGGANWTMENSVGGWHRKWVCVPDGDADDLHVFYCGADPDTAYKSTDGGGSFATQAGLNHPQHIRYRQATTAMYLADWDDVYQYNPVSGDFETWYPGGPIGAASPGVSAYDALCVGWGTDNALGYLIAAGTTGGPTPKICHYSDAGNGRDITNNLNAVISGGQIVTVIAREGGQWIE